LGRRGEAAGLSAEEGILGEIEAAADGAFVAGELGGGLRAGSTVEAPAEGVGIVVEFLLGLRAFLLRAVGFGVVGVVLLAADAAGAVGEDSVFEAGVAEEAPAGVG
jgi:hypothetical protein